MPEGNVKNEPLPDFDSKFWPKDSENYTFETKQLSCMGKHNFKQIEKAREIKCDCGVGFILSPDLLLRDGHVYTMYDKLVI